MRAFTSEEKTRIEEAQRSGRPLVCPACGVALDIRPVPTPESVSYVRRRVLVACPRCHAHVALDRD